MKTAWASHSQFEIEGRTCTIRDAGAAIRFYERVKASRPWCYAQQPGKMLNIYGEPAAVNCAPCPYRQSCEILRWVRSKKGKTARKKLRTANKIMRANVQPHDSGS